MRKAKKRPTEPLAKFSVQAVNLDQFSEKKQVPEQLEENGVGSQWYTKTGQ